MNMKEELAGKAERIREKAQGKEEAIDCQMIRLLRAEEIECRAALVKENGVSLLLYKDARVDQRILDETFTPFGWKRSHQYINGSLYCTVEILDKATGEWISKQDVGTVGYAEKEKSVASDSFKRACFNWGIGRELYTAPFIWIPKGVAEIEGKDGKYYCKEYFHVSEISYNEDREISELKIANKYNQVVFKWSRTGKGIKPEKEAVLTTTQLNDFYAEMKRTGVSMEVVKKRYGFKEPEQMSEKTYKQVMNALAKTKTRIAA